MNWIKTGLFVLLTLGMALQVQATDLESVEEVKNVIISESETLLNTYNPEEGMKTGAKFSRLYFDVFEASGMELKIGLLSQNLVIEIESDFGDLINMSMKGRPKDDLIKTYTSLKTNLQEAADLHENRSVTWASQFVQSLIILVREGVEALLVITALILYLKRSGNADRTPTIWAGAGVAVVLSVILAWGLMTLISLSGSYRENFEGFVMLFASLMMLYVSGWLYQKRNLDWKHELFSKMDSTVTTGGVIAMGMVSFLAVFREGIETIFFYQALLVDAQHSYEPIIAGIIVACLLLVMIYFAIKKFSYRLPVKQFFMFTAVFLLVMSFIFIGKGVLELQMGGILSRTALSFDFNVTWLGLFSNQETVLVQLLFAIAVLTFFIRSKRHKSNA
ncbi:hypothetical protein JCM30760_22070 [Thiomicrorhabdus hydrogeniphila]